MNFVQPTLQHKFYNKNRQKQPQKPKSLIPTRIVSEQIHNQPELISKKIAIGKYKKYHLHSSSQNKQEEKFNQFGEFHKQSIILMNLSQTLVKRNSLNTNNKKIQQQYGDIPYSTKNQVKKIFEKGQRILYIRKKLSPLKKNTIIPQKIKSTSDKMHVKASFFNVQKLNLVKMKSDVSSSKNSPYKKIQSSTIYEKSRYKSINTQQQYDKKDLMTSTTLKFFNCSQEISDSICSPIKNNVKTAFRVKNFKPPYEKYYYRDFLWKVALSHGLFFQCPQLYQQKFKIYLGRGNNSMLIKTLFKRRSAWWAFTQKYEQANFIWTQIKICEIFKCQSSGKKQQTLQSMVCQQGINAFELRKLGTSYQQHSKLLKDFEINRYNQYFRNNRRIEDKLDETMSKRNKNFKQSCLLQKLSLKTIKIHNHLQNNYVIGNKKALYYTMTKFYQLSGQDVFNNLPLTFHIQKGLEDPEYLKFLNVFYAKAKAIRQQAKLRQQSPTRYNKKIQRNIWIVKPGQFTNRGNGINVCLTLDDVKKILKKQQRHDNGNLKTYIIQSYIDKPFLYYRRKFDIRHYMMISSINGRIKGYWYELGYIRTTSFQYTLNQNNSSIHLTNDAVQKYLPQYGKYQKGNKLSYKDLQKYLDKEFPGKYDFMKTVYPKMRKIATDAIKASSLAIDPNKKNHNFQIFGMDFMIDCQFKPWLIEINTNPCLELSCPLLAQIIPEMVQNAFKICVDTLIPPPANFQQKRPSFTENFIQKNKFEVVYDSVYSQENTQKMKEVMSATIFKQLNIEEDDEIFQNDGIQLEY